MLPTLRFHYPLLRRTVSILVGAGVRYTTGAAIVSLAVTLLNPEVGRATADFLGGTWGTFSRWWSLIPLGLLFLLFVYGLMKANHEKFLEVEQERDDFRENLKAYENGDKPKIVARAENPGPVSIEEWAPDTLQEGENDPVCVVPYKPYETSSTFFDDPAATIEVEDAENDYLVVVDYEVRAENQPHPEGRYPMQIDVGVRVLSDDGQAARDLGVHSGVVWVPEDGRWQHTVHGNEILSGLPEGVYGINVFDILDVPTDFRENARREYRDMRLRVTRQ